MKNTNTFISIVIATMALVTTSEAQSWRTNGLLAYYTFDGTANDQSGNGNNASIHGATFTKDRFSHTNSALMFNGINNYAMSAVTNQPLGTAARTLTCWLEPLDNRAEGGVVYQGQGNCNGHLFGIGTWTSSSPTQMLLFWGGCQDWQSPLPLPTNRWSFVAFTYDGAGNLSAYLNQSNQSANVGTLSTLSAHFWMGGETGNDGSSFDSYYYGAMDDVRMYNRALSSNEVAQLYAMESEPPIKITQDLTNVFALTNHNITLAFMVSNSLPVTYQWYFVPADGSGQAGAYAQTISDFVYGAVVTNGGFGYGNVPNVTFVGGGGSGAGGYAMVSNGVVVGISVTNAGSQYGSLPAVVIDPPNGLYLGQTNSTLSISNINSSEVGSYYVVASDSTGNSVASSEVSLTLVYPPSITLGPQGFTNVYHGSNSLTVYAAGTSPLSYQWFLNGTNINQAIGSSYAIDSLDLAHTGIYTVAVSNLYGGIVGGPADVFMAPTLTSPFTGAIGLWGQDTTLGVGATGSGGLQYQWYFNGTAVPDATNSSYNLDGIQFTNAGLYSVVVSSAYGSVTNTAYQVVVDPADIAIGTCPIIYINGTVGYSYAIQSSTDLSNTNAWTTVTNLIIPSASFIWADTATDTSKPSNPHKYYRVIPGQ